ncbi:MAG TPA: hypothetical protein VMY69_06505 [Phycisphaerae bacterium]|nr:hypothetical protein [Phycisphaerae bacterium]
MSHGTGRWFLAGLMALAMLAAGCQSSPAERQSLHLRSLPPSPARANAPMIHVRVVRLQHRLRPDAPVEDLWRLLGTTNVPHEKRALWNANDLRLGDGAGLAADRMNELVTETPDRSAAVNVLFIRENMDFVISLGGEREGLDLVWSDASGQLAGRHFDKALPLFRLVCRADPEEPNVVRVALVPEVQYGPEQLRWIRTEEGIAQRMARTSFTLTDLAAEVRLPPGRLLVLGGRRSSDLSLGGSFFYGPRGPDTWVQTIILTAEWVQPGQIPEGQAVPFLPPAAPAGKPPSPPATSPSKSAAEAPLPKP